MADSTLRRSPQLDRYRNLAGRMLNRYAPELYTMEGTWSDGTLCHFGVKDVNKDTSGKGFAKLQTDPLPASLRLVKIQPGDPAPALGSSIEYQTGTLVLGLWGDESVYSGVRVGVCRLVDERLRLGLAAIPAALPTLTGAELDVIFAQLGRDLTIEYDPANSSWGTASAAGGLTIPVRGLLLPASVGRQQVAAGAGLPIPQYEAILPFGVGDLGTPGWHLEADGQRYYPNGDARDEGGQGVAWRVALGSPGEVNSGASQPGWTG